jgi:uncharacterized SAM-binding protein YcdF (DUF218 family)
MSKRRLAGIFQALCVGVTMLILVVALTPVVPFAASELATDWYEGDADVLIVLGGSMLVAGSGADATLGYESYLRCVHAWWNMQRFRYSYVVVTGDNGVAETMAAFFREKGVDPKCILLENRATSTFQNALYVKKLLEDRVHLPPHPRLALLTSDFHSRRAKLVFEHAGLHVMVIPVPDVSKQPDSPTARVAGFFILVGELGKYAYYAANGRL